MNNLSWPIKQLFKIVTSYMMVICRIVESYIFIFIIRRSFYTSIHAFILLHFISRKSSLFLCFPCRNFKSTCFHQGFTVSFCRFVSINRIFKEDLRNWLHILSLKVVEGYVTFSEGPEVVTGVTVTITGYYYFRPMQKVLKRHPFTTLLV